MSRTGTSAETEGDQGRLGLAGLGSEHGVSFWSNENVLELDSGVDGTTVNI